MLFLLLVPRNQNIHHLSIIHNLKGGSYFFLTLPLLLYLIFNYFLIQSLRCSRLLYICCVSEDGLKLLTFLPPPPKCWDDKHMPLCLPGNRQINFIFWDSLAMYSKLASNSKFFCTSLHSVGLRAWATILNLQIWNRWNWVGDRVLLPEKTKCLPSLKQALDSSPASRKLGVVRQEDQESRVIVSDILSSKPDETLSF